MEIEKQSSSEPLPSVPDHYPLFRHLVHQVFSVYLPREGFSYQEEHTYRRKRRVVPIEF